VLIFVFGDEILANCSDTSSWKGAAFAEDDDATFSGDVAFHEILFGAVSMIVQEIEGIRLQCCLPR
jgi:hypothetical protein